MVDFPNSGVFRWKCGKWKWVPLKRYQNMRVSVGWVKGVISRIALSGVFNQISRIVMNKGYEMSRYKMANWYISFITF